MSKTLKSILEWVRDIAIAIVIALIIMAFFKPIVIHQTSMVPTFADGDYIITSRQAYKLFGEPERGDVIVFKSDLEAEDGSNKNLIKRIIALPGDTIEIVDGYVYLNGSKLEEEYVAEEAMSGNLAKLTVKEGQLFVMGDNRRVSLDSRSLGPIDQSTVIGKVVLRVFPFNQIKTF